MLKGGNIITISLTRTRTINIVELVTKLKLFIKGRRLPSAKEDSNGL
jgi:hypothetical protein